MEKVCRDPVRTQSVVRSVSGVHCALWINWRVKEEQASVVKKATGGQQVSEPDDVVAGRLAALKCQFPDRLSPREWEKVRDGLMDHREKAAKLRAVPLTNGDEPATMFVVGRQDG